MVVIPWAGSVLFVCQGDLQEEELIEASKAGFTPIIPAFVRLTQEDCSEFQVSLG